MSADPARILVRTPNWLGDLVMSTPGFRALRARFPTARIDALMPEALIPALEGSPSFDALLPLASRRGGVAAIWREGRALRARGAYDLGVCIPESFSSALLMRLAGVKRVVGYRRGGRGWLLHQPLRAPAHWGRRRLVARESFVARLVEAVGAPADDLRLELSISASQEASAARVFREAGLNLEGERIVLAPGASYGPAKCWPAESFAAVGDEYAARGFQVVVVGSPAEAAIVSAVREAMRSRSVALVGADCDLGVLKVAIRGARALVSNDAGARHVAVAFGVPAAVVFGPTDLAKTDMNLERVATLSADGVECRPCYHRECPIDHRCMTRVEPARVLGELDRMLREASAPQSAGDARPEEPGSKIA